MIIGVSGTLGDGAFNGRALAGLSSKPLVKLDLDFQRLDLAAASARPPSQGLERPWSHATVDLIGLNYTDVRASLSAAEINIADTIPRPRSTPNWPAVSWSPLCRSRRLWRPGPGDLTVDATAASPAYSALRASRARALPLLRSAADLGKLDGACRDRFPK